MRLVLGDIQKGNANQYFDYYSKTISYIVVNGILLNKTNIALFDCMKHYIAYNNIQKELEKNAEYRYYIDHIEKNGWVSFYDTYFQYDDVRILRDKTVEILSE